MTSDAVRESLDVVDARVWQHIMWVISLGVVFYLHCGTPCNTYGGPPRLHSQAHPMGLSNLSSDNQFLVFLGNIFLGHTCEACVRVFDFGVIFRSKTPF